MSIDELDDVVLDLCRRHPRFRRTTIERLVARTAQGCRQERYIGSLVSAVLQAAEQQLRYLDDGATGDSSGSTAGGLAERG